MITRRTRSWFVCVVLSVAFAGTLAGEQQVLRLSKGRTCTGNHASTCYEYGRHPEIKIQPTNPTTPGQRDNLVNQNSFWVYEKHEVYSKAEIDRHEGTVDARIKALEEAAAIYTSNFTSLTDKISAQKVRIDQLEERIKDLEGR